MQMNNSTMLIHISPELLILSFLSSVSHVGEWEHPQPGRCQTNGIQEPFIQHGHWCRWAQLLHATGLDPPAGTVSWHHARPRFGSWDRGSGGPAALPQHQCCHSQQPAFTQRCVLVEQRHAATVRALEAPESSCTWLASNSSEAASVCSGTTPLKWRSGWEPATCIKVTLQPPWSPSSRLLSCCRWRRRRVRTPRPSARCAAASPLSRSADRICTTPTLSVDSKLVLTTGYVVGITDSEDPELVHSSERVWRTSHGVVHPKHSGKDDREHG